MLSFVTLGGMRSFRTTSVESPPTRGPIRIGTFGLMILACPEPAKVFSEIEVRSTEFADTVPLLEIVNRTSTSFLLVAIWAARMLMSVAIGPATTTGFAEPQSQVPTKWPPLSLGTLNDG